MVLECYCEMSFHVSCKFDKYARLLAKKRLKMSIYCFYCTFHSNLQQYGLWLLKTEEKSEEKNNDSKRKKEFRSRDKCTLCNKIDTVKTFKGKS